MSDWHTCLPILSLQLGMTVGLKGLQILLGSLPSWLSYTEQEKMEVRNQSLNIEKYTGTWDILMPHDLVLFMNARNYALHGWV